MSQRIVHRIWSFSSLAGTELLVLIALGDRADDDGRVTLFGLEGFAARVRQSVPGLQDILARLERKGELRELERYSWEIVCATEDLKTAAAREARS